MIRIALASLIVVLAGGCGVSSPVPRTEAAAQMFAPVSMRIHPIFTQIKDWTGDGQSDGVEALIEFQDQFNDPTKSTGTVIFELYAYRPSTPDSRGERLANPWRSSLNTVGEQQTRWNRTSRTYFFELAYPKIRDDQDYVLAATFDTGETRFFDQIVVEGKNAPHEHRSTTRPTTRAVSSDRSPDGSHAASRP